MSEPMWMQEMRQVRGIPKPDVVDREVRKWWDRYMDWQPTTQDYLKIMATVSVIGVLIYLWAARKSTSVSHA